MRMPPGIARKRTQTVMKNCLLLLALWLSLPLFAVDAEGEKMSSAIMFKQLNTTDGLSNNSVRCLFRDSRGFLWIGTESD